MKRREFIRLGVGGGLSVSGVWAGGQLLQTQTDHLSGGADSSMVDLELYAVAGQSNAKGNGSDAGSPIPDAGTAVEYVNSDGSINDPLDDPMSYNGTNADTGSAWPKFAVELYKRRPTTVGIVGTAYEGSAQHRDADNGFGNWDVREAGNLYHDSISFINNAISALESDGYTVAFRGVLWNQGEKDAQYIDDGTITKTQYKAAFQDMIEGYRSDLSLPEMPFWVFQTGKFEDGSHAEGMQAVRDAQLETTEEQDQTFMASAIQKNFADDGRMNDNVHYNQTGLNDMGAEGAETVASVLETRTSARARLDANNGVVQTTSGVIQTTSDTV